MLVPHGWYGAVQRESSPINMNTWVFGKIFQRNEKSLGRNGTDGTNLGKVEGLSNWDCRWASAE
jgi:hypothetical protein